MADTRLRAVATAEHRAGVPSSAAQLPAPACVGYLDLPGAQPLALATADFFDVRPHRSGCHGAPPFVGRRIAAFARLLHPLPLVATPPSALRRRCPLLCRSCAMPRLGVTRMLPRMRPSRPAAFASHASTAPWAQSLGRAGADRLRFCAGG